MKAVVYQRTKAGSFVLREVQRPAAQGSEVLVRVHAATVTAADASTKGSFLAIRQFAGSCRPREPIPGVEFAGEVEAVGPAVSRFKAGDRVIGSSLGFGAWAEYIRVREDGTLAPLPANLGYAEACSFCDGGITALLFLRELGNIRKGMKVLINGASGSVGSYAVQIARQAGVEVTAVCGPSNLELVRSLGADHAVDYTREDFTGSGQVYDVIFDAVGKSSFSRCKGSLKESGVYLTTVPSPGVILRKLWPWGRGGRRAMFMAAGLAKPAIRTEGLLLLKEMAEAGKLKPVVDKCYPLSQIADALRYVETGHKRGNVAVVME